MPRGSNKRKLSGVEIDEIVRRYTTRNPDGTWTGTTTLARDFGVRPQTISRWLTLRGVSIRSNAESHSGGKRCKPITNLPTGEPPQCKCGCAGAVAWNRRRNRWFVYLPHHYRQDAAYKDEAWLRRRYITDRATAAEIASECGVSRRTILHWADAFSIERRDRSASRAGRKVGALNPAWKGGVAQWAYSSDWKMLARQVRDRDEWTCQDCGERRTRWGNDLHVHHIDEDKRNNAPENLISLCASCHRGRHR